MKFVKDHRGDRREFGIINPLAEKHAFCHITDAGPGTGVVFKTDLISDFAADIAAAFRSHPVSQQARGDPPGLEHDNLAAGPVQKHLRDLRGFPGAGRCADNDPAAGNRGRAQRRLQFIDGIVTPVHCLLKNKTPRRSFEAFCIIKPNG